MQYKGNILILILNIQFKKMGHLYKLKNYLNSIWNQDQILNLIRYQIIYKEFI